MTISLSGNQSDTQTILSETGTTLSWNFEITTAVRREREREESLYFILFMNYNVPLSLLVFFIPLVSDSSSVSSNV